MGAVLSLTHGTDGGGTISAGYVLSQVISMRECHEMAPLDFSRFSNATLSIAHELAAKDRLVNTDGTPRSVWDDLDKLSNASKEALAAVMICNLRACKTGFAAEEYPGVDASGNPGSLNEIVRCHLEGTTTFMERMPDHHSLKTMPLLQGERISLGAIYSAGMEVGKAPVLGLNNI